MYVSVLKQVTFLLPKFKHVGRGGSPILWRASMTWPHGLGPKERLPLHDLDIDLPLFEYTLHDI